MATLAALIVAAGITVAIICRAIDSPPTVRSRPAAMPQRFAYGPQDYAAAIAQADRHVAFGEERVHRAPDQWAYQEYLAQALLGRARLNGSFDDLARARAALARGLADAPPGAGPLLTAVVADMAVHRLAPVAPLLAQLGAAAVPDDRGERAEATAIAGDLAFYSGRPGAARRIYAQAAALQNGAAVAVRLANWYMKMGQFDAALAQVEFAGNSMGTPTRLFHANLMVQRGSIELARGDWQAAEACFKAADAAFPGYWRTEAFAAQMAAAHGDLAAAETGYRAIVDRQGDAPPEVMDALAALYRTKGNAAESRAWGDRAAAIWAQRLALLPEAAVGHALEHELVLGNPARALALARQNVAARPYGDALVMLGWAQLVAGQPEDAVKTITALQASGWRTAQQYVVLSEALALLGRADASGAARRTALAINPRSFDPAASLLWFGNH
jgi:tetratricopeptide (TPR) repeat protein